MFVVKKGNAIVAAAVNIMKKIMTKGKNFFAIVIKGKENNIGLINLSQMKHKKKLCLI